MQGPTQTTLAKKVIALATNDKIYRLHKDRIVLGSVISADVRLTGDGVSPIHAVLEVSPNGTTIYDLASDTGVFVNGQKIVTRTLNAGDQITIGRHNLKFSLQELSQVSPDLKTRKSEGRTLFVNPGEDIAALLLEDERVVEDIFDYSKSNQQALQVVMSWRGTILDVEHFTQERSVTIGETRRSNFGIPPILGPGEYSLINQAGGAHSLVLQSQMKGVVQKKGELRPVEELKALGSQVPFEKGDFAKITLGEIDFYLSFTQAPPRLKSGRLLERDPLFMKVMMTSIALTALTVAALLKLPVDQQLEAEEVPERIATILYQPEKFVRPAAPVPKAKPETVAVTKPVAPVTPPKPKEPTPQKTTKIDVTPKNVTKPVPKEMVAKNDTSKTAANANNKRAASNKSQSQAKEGQGARAKGKEGARGDRKAAPGKDKQTAAFRPSPQGGPGRGAGDSQIKDEGNVDILKGASSKILDVLGNSAAQLGKGGEKLKGFGGFSTQGDGGLALSGSGSGGGGDAASLGGLGKEGRGGGKVGTGLGAAGAGNGIIGGSSRVVLRTGGPEETVVIGMIDADAIAAALAAHRERFRLCYEKEINAENPPGSGSVGTSFTIASNGRVSQAGIESTTLKNPRTESCITGVIKTIQFPIPRGAGIVQVTYPFKFAPVGK